MASLIETTVKEELIKYHLFACVNHRFHRGKHFLCGYNMFLAPFMSVNLYTFLNQIRNYLLIGSTQLLKLVHQVISFFCEHIDNYLLFIVLPLVINQLRLYYLDLVLIISYFLHQVMFVLFNLLDDCHPMIEISCQIFTIGHWSFSLILSHSQLLHCVKSVPLSLADCLPQNFIVLPLRF